MSRLKLLVITAVVLGVLLFGAVAYAGWSWNSEIDVEGVIVHTVWTVDNGEPKDALNDYRAKIELILPMKAEAQIISFAENAETIVIKHKGKLKCTSKGIEASARYVVTANDDATGEHVTVTVTTAKKKGKEDILGRVSGKVGKNLKLNFIIPTEKKAC